ncbi:MAG: acetylornithine/succinylornithine family transaminase [Candidatus Altiarchaeota archaeon]
MDYKTAVAWEEKYFANVFSRLPVLLVKGKGNYVYDDKGRKYLDLFAGIAVSSVGHAHPKVVKAISEQAAKIIHTSNWVYSEPQLHLAKKITQLTGMEKVFLTNDGTGAVETAFKLARKHTKKKGLIAMEQGFHGRSMGALSATWTEKYRKPFEPLVPGTCFVKYDDVDAVRAAITDDTAAVIVEPIQGEAGVIVPDKDYLQEVRELTEEKGVLMIVDEVQTGFGRTGEWFEFQRSGIKPDIVCMAKGIAGGYPMGAVAYRGMDFEKGQQGGTFNGSPLACTVANTVLGIIEQEKLVKNAAKTGAYIMKNLPPEGIHGRGLIIGADVDDAPKRAKQIISNGAIAIYSGNTMRILPPLTVKKGEADMIIRLIEAIKNEK